MEKMVAEKMVAPVIWSVNNSIYMYVLLIQDYFTKWVEAIQLPYQTAKYNHN